MVLVGLVVYQVARYTTIAHKSGQDFAKVGWHPDDHPETASPGEDTRRIILALGLIRPLLAALPPLLDAVSTSLTELLAWLRSFIDKHSH